MAVDDVLDDGQAQPGAAHGPGPALVGPVEPLRQARDVGACDALPIVGDGQHHAGPGRPPPAGGRLADRHRHRTALPAVFRGVVQQVLQHLLQLVVVAWHGWQAGLQVQVQADLAVPDLRFEGGSQALHQAGQVHPVGRRLVFRQLDARQAQQVVDQAVHALRLVRHDAQEPRLCRRVVGGGAAQGVDEADQAGERCAQLVAGIGDEVRAHPFHRTLPCPV